VKPPEKSDLAKRMIEDLGEASPRIEIKAVRAEPVRAEPVRAEPLVRPEPVVRSIAPAQDLRREAREESGAAEPVRKEVSREIVREVRRKGSANVQRKIDFEVSTGQGTRHLTLRVPKDLAGDLSLLAMKNKLAENGEPTTINELGITALRRLLSEAA